MGKWDSKALAIVNNPAVAVVVPTYNRKAKTLRFLERMRSQTYSYLHVFVVDASSSDGTQEAVKQHYPEVTVLSVSARNFWTGSTNAGVKRALTTDAEYIFTVNDDSILADDHIEQLVKIAQRCDCWILGNRINYLAERDRIWSLGCYTDWGTPDFLRLADADVLEQDLPDEVRQREVMETEALPGNGVLIHRRVFEQIGLYNERWLPHYHADSEFTMRARSNGIPVFVSPQVVLYNDFSVEQKKLRLNRWADVYYTFCHRKSHLFWPPLMYIFFRYCPWRSQWKTFRALAHRLWLLVRG
ncbi:glycosyltransferase family 2 protein [Leptolyngbya sp. AN02str]|uniref:glycosyltransferase family 2 protein n=1 Tax=Leptolyngbya sp. AN02str TaxID=3423363 RepID=UPI003D320A1A